ncbi:MAG: hypothetical protein OXN97_03475 [Bryobacterales bacterium]|nr:hypothetical protein [Bryobacterales bacterium]
MHAAVRELVLLHDEPAEFVLNYLTANVRGGRGSFSGSRSLRTLVNCRSRPG